jgi:uncharacterized protein (DUF1697 family)
MVQVGLPINSFNQAAGLAESFTYEETIGSSLVVREPIGRAALKREFLRVLPFDTEVITCSGRALQALVKSEPFPTRLPPGDVRRFLAVMAKPPARVPPLPLRYPTDAPWQITFVVISGVFACGWWRRRGLGKGLVDPNGVTEKVLGVRSTARNWNTIEKLRDVLTGPGHEGAGDS